MNWQRTFHVNKWPILSWNASLYLAQLCKRMYYVTFLFIYLFMFDYNSVFSDYLWGINIFIKFNIIRISLFSGLNYILPILVGIINYQNTDD